MIDNLIPGKCYSMNLSEADRAALNVSSFWTIREPYASYFYNEPFILLAAKRDNIFIKILYKGKVHFMATYNWMIFEEV